MGIYTNKVFKEEVSPEDVINTPDDIGVELDTIEKAICGPDGIESHRDDVEDALSGVVGDPLEEGFNIIYESEYNYNQIMRCIGMNELKHYAEGVEYVFTEADKNGYFERIKEWWRNLWAKFVEGWSKFVNKVREFFKVDKAFAEKNAEKIKEGYAKCKEKGSKFTAYDFSTLDEINADHAYFTIKQDPTPDTAELSNEDALKMSLTRSGVYELLGNDTTMDNLVDRLNGYLYGNKHENVSVGDLNGTDAESIIARMKENLLDKTIKEKFAEVKNTIHENMKVIDNLRQEASKNSENAEADIAKCASIMTVMRHDMRVLVIKQSAYMRALRARATRDRALAHKYYAAVKEKEDKVNTESATKPIKSIAFSSMNFI